MIRLRQLHIADAQHGGFQRKKIGERGQQASIPDQTMAVRSSSQSEPRAR